MTVNKGFGLGADDSLSRKVEHVKSQKGDSTEHHCHGQMPGCAGECPPAQWGCRNCWMKLPKRLRDLIWRAYRVGQEQDKRPSREYVAVAREVQTWIDQNYRTKEKT